MSHSVHFFERPFPSANMILLTGKTPILVDSGFGTDFEVTCNLLVNHNIVPQQLQMMVNTHWHCDHAGGNHQLQQFYSVPIAAHAHEAQRINERQTDESVDAVWLGQPIEPYTVDLLLKQGDVLDTGSVQWLVLETPGHSAGHISLYADGVLIAGDTVHDDDVAWLNPILYPDAMSQIMTTLDTLAALRPHVAYSGHGAANHHPLQRIDAARRRYERWSKNSERIGWHAMKRIFTYHLMLVDGLDETGIRDYLLNALWFRDYTQQIFKSSAADFLKPFMAEIKRSAAAEWRGDKLYPAAPYRHVPLAWVKQHLPD